MKIRRIKSFLLSFCHFPLFMNEVSWRTFFMDRIINFIDIDFSYEKFFALGMLCTFFQIIHLTLVCFFLSPRLNKSPSLR